MVGVTLGRYNDIAVVRDGGVFGWGYGYGLGLRKLQLLCKFIISTHRAVTK